MRRKHRIYSIALPVLVITLAAFTGQTTAVNDAVVAAHTAEASIVYNNLYANVGNPEYSVMQGGCTDGTYAYFVMENQALGICELVKLSLSDWSIVKVGTDLDINHGNDLTYNAKTGKIVAVHNKPNYNTLSVIDPETLKVESQVTLDSKVYSIAYNEAADQYVVGISGTQEFQILNSNFKILKTYTGIETDYVHQGMDCDDKYIYFIQSSTVDNSIVVYDWDGQYVKTIKVDVPLEGESLFHAGSTYYANFHSAQYRGTVCQLELPLK